MRITANIKYISWILLSFFLFSAQVLAQSTVTVRVYPDANGNDTTLNNVLYAIGNQGLRVDTVILAGNELDTFVMSRSVSSVIGDMPSITFKSEKYDPDSFPVINHTASGYYSLFVAKDIHFERVTITSSSRFEAQGQSQKRIYSFTNCVIKDCTDEYFIVFKDKRSSEIRIENCLFVNNNLNKGLIHVEFWDENYSKTDFSITNCTFDNNNIVFDMPGQISNNSNLSIKNCIFSNNPTIFPNNSNGATLKSYTTYSITNQYLSGYGDYCIRQTNPRYTVTPHPYREKPSDWRITDLSPAKNHGTSSVAPSIDIGSNMRRMAPDIGAWETLNLPPQNITISNDTIDENLPPGTFTGVLSTVDPNLDGETFDYEFVSGFDDNDAFSISNDTLFTSEIFDFETKSTYNIKIRTTDTGGLSFDTTIVINIRDVNEKPDSLILSNNEIEENSIPPAFIGTLSTVDPDTNDSFTYSFVNGFDEARFDISNDTLYTSQNLDYETDSLFTVKIRSTDNGGLTAEKEFAIKIFDVPEPPYLLILSNDTILSGSNPTVIGIFEGIDPEQNVYDYVLVDGEGDDDNELFIIAEDTLKNRVILNYDTAKTEYSIRVKVTDSTGLFMDSVFTIKVASPPLILTEPSDTLIIGEGKRLEFSVLAAGTPPLEYQWYRNGKPVTGANYPTVSRNSVSVSYDSSIYYCVIENGYGTDTTREAFLRVLAVPEITGDLEDTVEVIVKKELYLSVETSGEQLSFLWIKNEKDTVGTDSVFSIDTVSANDSGFYKCIVKNIAGNYQSKETFVKVFFPPVIQKQPKTYTVNDGDSFNISVTVSGTEPLIYQWFGNGEETGENSNVLSFKASYSDNRTEFYCKISNVAGTVNSDTVTLTVDSVGPQITEQSDSVNISEGDSARFFVTATGTTPLSYAWFKQGVPDDTLGNSDILIMKNLTVNDSGSVFYCVVSNIADTVHSEPVLLSVTEQPVHKEGDNPIIISAKYFRQTDIIISLKNLNDIHDSSLSVDSVGIWYLKDSIPSSPSSSWNLKNYSMDELTNDSGTYIDTLTVSGKIDETYGLITGLYFKSGKISVFSPSNGCLVLLNDTSTPEIKINISGNYLKDDSALIDILDISSVDTTRIDSIGFCYTLDSSLISFTSNDVRWFCAKKVLENSSDDKFSFVIHDSAFLGIEKTIWIGVVLKSKNSKLSSAVVSSFKTVESSIHNNAVIKKLVFDTLSAQIRIMWCVEEFDESDFEIGISYSTEHVPSLEFEISQIIPVKDSCSETVLQTNGSILFNTRYYIALWLKTGDEKWTSPSSTDSITTPDFTREIVEFFDKSVERDTVFAFNGTVQLWKDITFQTDPVEDTIAAFKPVEYKGMIDAGNSINFLCKYSGPPFFIGLRYSNLPSGYSPSDLCLYRDSSGVLLAEHGSVVDSVNNIVYVKTSNLRFPFLLLIDTLAPQLDPLTDIDTVAIPGHDINDAILITDNIANVLWTYIYGRGEEAPGKHSYTDTLHTISDIVYLTISSDENVINPDNSTRAYFIVSDGVHRDTLNMSKRVYREKSDEITTSEMEWSPLFVTAELENDSPEFVISKIMKSENPVYDTKYLRMFRWFPNRDNRSSDDKWVEYSKNNSSIFNFSPGKLIWVKTRENIHFDFGSAVTLSLKEGVNIKLPPENWTDFALPHKFDIRIADIIDSTNAGNDLQIYSWETEHKTNRYRTHGIYLPEFTGDKTMNSVLKYENNSCYSVYNPLEDTVTLNIPPIPVAMSPQRNLSKKKTDQSWSVIISGETEKDGLLPDVHCGYVPGNSDPYYPAPPSFSKARVKVYNRAENRTYGHFMQRKIDEALTQEISFTNNSSEPVKISFSLLTNGSFPSDYKALIYNPATNRWESKSTVSVDANSSVLRWLAASDDTFRKKFGDLIQTFKYSLCAAYPNPFRSTAYIRYTVPLGAKDKLRFSIFDVLGRRVWNKLLTPSSAGAHTLIWDAKDSYNKPVKSGIYFIQLSVLSEGHTTKQFKSKLTYLP